MKPFIEISSTNKLFNFMEILRIHKAFLEPQGHLKTVTGHPKESFFLNNPIFQSSNMHSHSISMKGLYYVWHSALHCGVKR